VGLFWLSSSLSSSLRVEVVDIKKMTWRDLSSGATGAVRAYALKLQEVCEIDSSDPEIATAHRSH
jgi:hypothetical protein